MEGQIINLVLVLAGSAFLIRNLGMFFNQEKLANYVKTNPKAKLWLNKFGEEKTSTLTRNIFLPLGTLVCLVLIVAGCRNLAILNGFL